MCAEAQQTQSATCADAEPKARTRRRFTKTQEEILRYVAGETALHGGACCTKRDLAKMLGCCVKTVDRGLSDLRREGVIEAEMRFDESSGAQLSSIYRVNFDTTPS